MTPLGHVCLMRRFTRTATWAANLTGQFGAEERFAELYCQLSRTEPAMHDSCRARQVCRNILCANDFATTTPWAAQQMGF